ncbi:MAG: NAD-dependent epimerase/dehydratase family protein [Proteobacteria bacterium]|nr:NAD-dependent epimerase/dehydratase family protein [Pseudomonadota bacterium]
METVLITGSSGYIGSKLVESLQQNTRVEQIIGLDLKPSPKPQPKLHFYCRDIREPLNDLLNRHDIDTVIHTAYVLPPLHNKKLMEDININGTKNVMALCEDSKVSHLIYTSSTTAYGFHPDNPVPMDETQPLRGNEDFIYSKNKREIENLFKGFITANKNIDTTILRASFVIGPTADNPVSRYIKKKIAILPKENAAIQFVHENDLTRAILWCLEKKISGIFNITGEGAVSFPDMITAMGNVPVFLPYSVLKLLNEVAWKFRLKVLTETPSAGLAMIRFPWIATARKFIDQTGFQFEYSSQQAFESFVEGG